MSVGFGQYAQQQAPVDAGIYDAIIESASVVREESGALKFTESGKNQVDIVFRLNKDTTLKRRFSISFGKNKQTGQYAAFASFIAAATGIPNGDTRQRNVTEDDLRGQRVRIVVEVTDEGFSNISSVAPPPKGRQAAAVTDEDPFEDGVPAR